MIAYPSFLPATKLRFAISLALAIVVLLCAAHDGRAASDAGKLEKTEIVLAYPQASGVFTPIFVANEPGSSKIRSQREGFTRSWEPLDNRAP